MDDQRVGDWRLLLIGGSEKDFLTLRDGLFGAKGPAAQIEWARDCEPDPQDRTAIPFDAVLVASGPNRAAGLEIVRRQAGSGRNYPVILYADRGDIELNLDAMEAGATVCLPRGEIDPRTLERVIRAAIQQKRVNQAHTASLLQNSIILESIPDGLFGIDRNWCITYINQPALSVTGMSEDQVTGSNIWELFPLLRGTQVEKCYRRAMDKRVKVKFETEGAYDGKWYGVSVHPSAEGISILWHDLTDRKRMEEQLEISERRYREIVKYAPTAIYEIDFRTRRFTSVNDWMVELSGYSREELLQMDPLDLMDEEGRALFQERIRCWLSGEKPDENVEYRIRAKDGHTIYAMLSVTFKRDDAGRPLGATVVGHDITTRKQAEMELLATNEALRRAQSEAIDERNRLQAVMEALPVAVAILDEQGGHRLGNRAYDELWGSSRPNVKSVEEYQAYQAWWAETGKLVAPEEWASARAVQHGETTVGQYLQIQKFDGTRAFILNSGAPIRDSEGQISGSVAAIMDITERVRMERSLFESNQALEQAQKDLLDEKNRLLAVLEALPVGLAIFNDQGERTQWNRTFSEIWGDPLPEVNALEDFQAYQAWWGETDRVVRPEEWALSLAVQTGITVDNQFFRIQRFDGREAYVLNSAAPVRDFQKRIVGGVVALMDITAQKLAEIDRQNSQTQVEVQQRLMEQREQERQEVARELHDGPIQTLAAISIHLKLIQDTFPDPGLQVELNQMARDIKSVVRELREMLNDLRPPSLMHFGLGRVIQLYVLDLNERNANLKIEADLQEDDRRLPEQTNLALFRIFQAAINNIQRHSGATRAWVKFVCESDKFLLEIRDNGCGFENPHNFAQLAREGHFGLVGMKERAEAIGAEFQLTSETGKGTTIQVKGRLENNRP